MTSGRFAKSRRIFYIGNAFEGSVKRERHITTDSPAASRKVAGLCQSVHAAGGNVWIVSLGRGRSKKSWSRYSATARRLGGVPIIYLDFWDIPVLTHFVTMISLCMLLSKLVRRDSTLVFYNYYVHYLGAAVIARLVGLRCILDLEDGPRSNDISMRSRIDFSLLRILSALCRDGAMLACTSLKHEVAVPRTYVCYGVAEMVRSAKTWTEPPLQVLLSGSLTKDRGAGLFVETLSLLMRKSPDTLLKLRFVVTGSGEWAAQLEGMARADFKAFLVFRGNASNREYREIVQNSHVGLCLNLPSTLVAGTTFPSKVIEFASHGLLIVSTAVSDVPLLFGSSTAILLEHATAEALSVALIQIASDPGTAQLIAAAGQERVASLLAKETVGLALLRFLNGEAMRLAAHD